MGLTNRWKCRMRTAKSKKRSLTRKKAPFPVRKYHIDTNEHVNNCQYVQMAMDYLPENFKIHQMRAEYKQQARLNDVICPARAVDENKTTVLLNDQKGEPYAVVEFK